MWFRSAGAAGMVALLFTLDVGASGWPTKGRDARRTSQSDVAGPRSAARVTVVPLAEEVAVNMPLTITDGGMVFVGTWGVVRSYGESDAAAWNKSDGALFAFDPRLRPLWTFEPDRVPYCYEYGDRATPLFCPNGGTLNGYNGTVEGVAALDASGSRLYVGRGDGNFFALDARTGALSWRFTTFNPEDPLDPEGGGEIIGGPLVGPDGTIYFATVAVGPHETNAVYAVSPEGALLWRYPQEAKTLQETLFAAPALSPDGKTLYVASAWGPTAEDLDVTSRGAVYAFDVGRGEGTGEQRLKWRFEPVNEAEWWKPPVWTSALAVGSDGTIYGTGTEYTAGGGSAVLYALRDGGDRASYAWPRMVDLDRGRARTSQGLALREVDGVTTRVYATSGNFYTPLAAAYPPGGKLYAIHPATGVPLWDTPFDPEAHGATGAMSGIAIDSHGVVYTAVSGAQDRGRVFAIDEDGSLRWQFETGGLIEWAHPVLGPQGTIYVADTRRCPWTFVPIESGSCNAWNITPAVYAISDPPRRRAVRSGVK